VWQEAEEDFLKALEIARGQEARSLGLRAAMSLTRLWQQQNKGDDARKLLEESYGWFTEGFETTDLQEAEVLLRELGSSLKMSRKASLTSKVQRLELKKQENAPRAQTLVSKVQEPFVTDQTLAPLRQTPDVPSPAPNSFRREGEYWTVHFAGVTCRLKDARGFHYLAHLLRHPHQEFHALALAGAQVPPDSEGSDSGAVHDSRFRREQSEGSGDAGDLLDPQARLAYKRRRQELQEALEEARRFNDLGQIGRLNTELDFLTHELSRAVGLGGRARKAASIAERARVNVTKAMKIALQRINQHHPALGQHLATAIKTGAYCAYTPDPRLPISWQV
jgi:hypothetical protein